MKKLTILTSIFLFFLLPDLSAEVTPPPIKIGSILMLSGEGASWGISAKNGIEMAIEEINSTGGVLGRPLEVLHQDDRGDPKSAISAFRTLTDNNGVKFIIGTNWSNTGIPLIEPATTRKVIMISPSLGVAQFNEGSPYLFNTWPHDYILSEQLARYVFEKGHRRIALVGAEQVWVKEQSQAFRRVFEQLGGTIVYMTEPLPGSTDVRTDALKIKNLKDLDAVVSTSDGIIIGSLVAKALKEMNVKLPFFSVTLDQSAIDAAHGGFEGLEFYTSLTPTAQFKKAYEDRFKIPIDIGADSAFDAVMMLAQAMKSCQCTDTTRVAETLAAVTTYNGASGVLISDGRRGFTKTFAIRKVVAGKPQEVETAPQ